MAEDWDELREAYDANMTAWTEYFAALEQSRHGDPLAQLRQGEVVKQLVDTHRRFLEAGAKVSGSAGR